jgi:hypothetical protein
MKQTRFPTGWDNQRVQRVLAYYESQTDEEAVVEDEVAYEGTTQAMMEVPREFVLAVRELLAKQRA